MSIDTSKIKDTDWLVCTDDDGVTKKVSGLNFKTLFPVGAAPFSYLIDTSLNAFSPGNTTHTIYEIITLEIGKVLTIDWGDGNSTQVTTVGNNPSNPSMNWGVVRTQSHTYASQAEFTVTISIENASEFTVFIQKENSVVDGTTTMLVKSIDATSTFIFAPYHATPLRTLAIEKGYIKEDEICSLSNTSASMLNMPTISKEEISGLAKVFSLYIKFPKERWPEIKIAEKSDKEGNLMMSKLGKEFDKSYRQFKASALDLHD